MMPQRQLRDALSCFATGVTIVTARGQRDELIGVTASSFNAVSLDPPLILFSLDRRAHSLSAFLSTTQFAVNVLRKSQSHLSSQFAKALGEKWSGVPHHMSERGNALLTEALAVFECKTRHTYDGGDHIILVGEVLEMNADLDGDPLVFYRGKYRELSL
jgi:flavin reductase (DIM6/NTAB) family NADH-FMN oxidoreductase RutF